jgi:hypothetical protein
MSLSRSHFCLEKLFSPQINVYCYRFSQIIEQNFQILRDFHLFSQKNTRYYSQLSFFLLQFQNFWRRFGCFLFALSLDTFAKTEQTKSVKMTISFRQRFFYFQSVLIRLISSYPVCCAIEDFWLNLIGNREQSDVDPFDTFPYNTQQKKSILFEPYVFLFLRFRWRTSLRQIRNRNLIGA